jgi:hypothetical protein
MEEKNSSDSDGKDKMLVNTDFDYQKDRSWF